jgi:hypothetical protein
VAITALDGLADMQFGSAQATFFAFSVSLAIAKGRGDDRGNDEVHLVRGDVDHSYGLIMPFSFVGLLLIAYVGSLPGRCSVRHERAILSRCVRLQKCD